jgi:hypothetical protein
MSALNINHTTTTHHPPPPPPHRASDVPVEARISEPVSSIAASEHFVLALTGTHGVSVSATVEVGLNLRTHNACLTNYFCNVSPTTTEGGNVYSWGGSGARLGHGDDLTVKLVPHKVLLVVVLGVPVHQFVERLFVLNGCLTAGPNPPPLQIMGLSGIACVACGHSFAAAISRKPPRLRVM